MGKHDFAGKFSRQSRRRVIRHFTNGNETTKNKTPPNWDKFQWAQSDNAKVDVLIVCGQRYQRHIYRIVKCIDTNIMVQLVKYVYWAEMSRIFLPLKSLHYAIEFWNGELSIVAETHEHNSSKAAKGWRKSEKLRALHALLTIHQTTLSLCVHV